MDQLAQSQAMHILVLNLPDLGAVPATLGTPEAAQATAFSINFNAELGNMLNMFRSDHPQIGVYEFDIFVLFAAVRNDPAAFGFNNVDDPSPDFAIPDNFDGAGYVFWDDIHPTTQMHALIADQVDAYLNRQIPALNTSNPAPQDDSDSSCFIDTLSAVPSATVGSISR